MLASAEQYRSALASRCTMPGLRCSTPCKAVHCCELYSEKLSTDCHMLSGLRVESTLRMLHVLTYQSFSVLLSDTFPNIKLLKKQKKRWPWHEYPQLYLSMHCISILYSYFIQAFVLKYLVLLINIFVFYSRIACCLFTTGDTEATMDLNMASSQCAHLIVTVVRVLEVRWHLVLVGFLHNPGH